MKKYLILFISFFSSFILIDKVNALTITHYYKEGGNSSNPQLVEFIQIPEENILPECRDKLYYFYSMGINSAGHYYVRGTCIPANSFSGNIYNLYNDIYAVGKVLKNYNQYSYNIDMTTLQMTRPGTWNNDYQYWNPTIRSNTISSTNLYIASDFDLYYGSTEDTKIIIDVPPSNPEFAYNVLSGTDYGRKLRLLFTNFNPENSYAKITELSSGNIYNINPLSDGSSNFPYDIDNISYDSVFLVEAYNNDELIVNETIDVEARLSMNSNNPYISFFADKEELSTTMTFHKTKDNQQFYYSLNNGNFISTESTTSDGIIVFPFGFDGSKTVVFDNSGTRYNKNYVIRGQIRDNNNQVIYDKAFNVVLFDDKPYFTFLNSYDNTTGGSLVSITYHNPRNNDIVYYSYDNESFTQFDNIRLNRLDIYMNTPLYTRAYNSNDYVFGYFYVNINSFESSANINNNSDNKDLLGSFNDVFRGVNTSFLSNITNFFNSLKSSFIYKYLLLLIVGAFILLIMKLIRR